MFVINYLRSLYLYINKVFFIHCPTLILTLNVAAFIAWWELFILCKWFSIIRSVSCIVGNTDYILFKWTDNFWCCIVLWGSCSSICNIPSGALWAVDGLSYRLLFLLTIVFFIILRFNTSDFSFGMFKPIFVWHNYYIDAYFKFLVINSAVKNDY